MELDVTQFVTEYDMFDFAHSAAEGGQDAGQNAWNAAMECPVMFVTDGNRDTIERWVRDFGAWDREEIEAWSDVELNALLLQFIAGDARETERDDYDPEKNGNNIHHGANGKVYFYVGC